MNKTQTLRIQPPPNPKNKTKTNEQTKTPKQTASYEISGQPGLEKMRENLSKHKLYPADG